MTTDLSISFYLYLYAYLKLIKQSNTFSVDTIKIKGFNKTVGPIYHIVMCTKYSTQKEQQGPVYQSGWHW